MNNASFLHEQIKMLLLSQCCIPNFCRKNTAEGRVLISTLNLIHRTHLFQIKTRIQLHQYQPTEESRLSWKVEVVTETACNDTCSVNKINIFYFENLELPNVRLLQIIFYSL